MTARSFASALWSSVTTPTASTVSTSTEQGLLRLQPHPTNNPTMCSPHVTFAQKTGHPSVPISEGRHPLLDPPPQGGGGKASPHAECYLCSRSKVLPIVQVSP